MTQPAHAAAAVLLQGSGPVRRLTLNRPDRHNAQTLIMWQEFAALGGLLIDDPEVRCVVLTGAGRSFSSGLDHRELQPGGHLAHIAHVGLTDPERAASLIGQIQQYFAWIRSAPFPVVAAVRGSALGAGLELALACDIRIVADDARLALPEVQMGVVPDLGGCHALRAAIGYERALDLIATGRTIDGRQAVALGLALEHQPESLVEDRAMQYAQTLAQAPRAALDLAKRAVAAQTDQASLAHAATGMVTGLGRLLAAGPDPVRHEQQSPNPRSRAVVPATAGG